MLRFKLYRLGRNAQLSHRSIIRKNLDKESDFIRAVCNNRLSEIEILLSAPSPVLSETSQICFKPLLFSFDLVKLKALHLAAIHGHNDMIDLLIGHDANLKEQDSEGMSALLHAVCAGQIATVDHLLAYYPETSLEQTNIHGISALGCALLSGQTEMAKHLLTFYATGINLETKSNNAFHKVWRDANNPNLDVQRIYQTPNMLHQTSAGYSLNEILEIAKSRLESKIIKIPQPELFDNFYVLLRRALKLQHATSEKLNKQAPKLILELLSWPGFAQIFKALLNADTRAVLISLTTDSALIRNYSSLMNANILPANNLADNNMVIEEVDEIMVEAVDEVEVEQEYTDSDKIEILALACHSYWQAEAIIMNSIATFLPLIQKSIDDNDVESDAARWILIRALINQLLIPELLEHDILKSEKMKNNLNAPHIFSNLLALSDKSPNKLLFLQKYAEIIQGHGNGMIGYYSKTKTPYLLLHSMFENDSLQAQSIDELVASAWENNNLNVQPNLIFSPETTIKDAKESSEFLEPQAGSSSTTKYHK